MAQIGFTHKTEPIYDRFQAIRREYELLHGRTYAPEFLAVLMDRWFQSEQKRLIEKIKEIDAELSLRNYTANAEANEPKIQDLDGDYFMDAIRGRDGKFWGIENETK